MEHITFMEHITLKTPIALFDGQRSYHVLTSAGYDDQSCHCGALELWTNKENHQVVIVCDDSITCESKGSEGLIVILDNPTDCTLTSCNDSNYESEPPHTGPEHVPTPLRTRRESNEQ